VNILERIMEECNNYFYRWKETKVFKIENNVIEVNGTYLTGQYICISGSAMNDGVYKAEIVANNKITLIGLTDEVFEGIIYGLTIQKGFIELSKKIEEYISKNVVSNKSSEGFNNYSVSMAKDKDGKPLQWQEIFESDLNIYRQAFDGKRWVKEI